MSMDDRRLFERWSNGDRDAGNALFQRHFQSVYRFFEHAARAPEDAEELVQETFLACVRNRDKFRHEGNVRAFLFGIARNRLHVYWRQRARAARELNFSSVSVEDMVTTPRTRIARAEGRQRLLIALRSLPLEQQLLLMLHYWEGMDQYELGEVFEVAPATTRSRMFRARKALREKLQAMTGTSADQLPEMSLDDLDHWVQSARARARWRATKIRQIVISRRSLQARSFFREREAPDHLSINE